jgi:predicted dehydrogenase
LQAALEWHPNIALITNPTALHVETALACAEANCHLFIEKPLSHTMDGCAELEALVKQRRLVTMIGCQFRFHPLLNRLREQLHAGCIGKVIGAHAEWGEYLPNWHPWEDHRRSYSARKDLGGGVILTLIHPLDYLYWLFDGVKRVHASISSIASLQTDVEDDLAEITLEFTSGVVAQVHLDYIQRPPVHTLTVWGENGRVKWDYYAGTLRWEFVDGHTHVEQVPAGFERNTMFIDELRHFLECVEQNKSTRVPLEDGIEVLKIAIWAKQNASGRSQHG